MIPDGGGRGERVTASSQVGTLVDLPSRFAEEELSMHSAAGDVEGVEPVVPFATADPDEAVIDLPTQPFPWKQADGWRATVPTWHPMRGRVECNPQPLAVIDEASSA